MIALATKITARIRRPLLAVGFAGCLAILASPAAATGTGAITGHVTNNAASPTPLANLCIYAYDASTGKSAGSTTTSATGQYTISGPPTGSYKVEFYDCSGAGYVTQFYSNKPNLPNALKVSVTAPETTTGINAQMAPGGKIKGKVTNNFASPVPLPNICVAAFPPSGTSAVAYAHTNLAGQYALAGLPTGSFKVEFYDCAGTFYITQYYDNVPNMGAAKLVPVTAPNITSGISAKLVRGGNITGTVTNNAASPAPLAKICVEAFNTTGSLVGSSSTVANGQYKIASVPPGSYRVEFIDCASSAYVTQYYNNKTTLITANPITVTTASTTSGINAQLVHV